MIAQDKIQGERIDAFLEHHTSENFDYVECTGCNSFHDVSKVNFKDWKFSAMGLRPSILRVAKGLCPTCQEMRKQFKGVLDQ